MQKRTPIAKAIQLIKQGKHTQATVILKDIISQDQDNERAWLILSQISSIKREKIVYLKQVLRINPDNEKARQLLNQLENVSPNKKPPTNKKRGAFLTRSKLTLLITSMVIVILSLGVGAGWTLITLYNNSHQIPASYAGMDVNATVIFAANQTLTANATDLPLPSITPTSTLSQTPTSSPTATLTPTQTSTFTATPSPTNTYTPTPSASPSPTSSPTLFSPEEARIENITGTSQTCSLSCESNSATDWAHFFDVDINEVDFFKKLPVSDNPNVGFVGDVHGDWGQLPPNPYGVHAGPVAAQLREHGLNAIAIRHFSWQNLQHEIASNRPVITWVAGKVERGITAVSYTASDGETCNVARYEHTVIVIGYDQESVTILDGKSIYTRPIAIFMDSWNTLENMVIIMGTEYYEQ